MRTLIVVAHPLKDSFTQAVAERIKATLQRRGVDIDLIDLYADGFDPRLSEAERRGYFATPYDSTSVADYLARLKAADKLVFVFPQWWFNMPAILKGFFDRVLVPGVAFNHAPRGGLTPALTQITAIFVVTSTGSPWWMARLYMGDPVRRQIGRGVKAAMCPKAKFRMLTLHDMDRFSPQRGENFLDRVQRALRRF
ncbi:MAG: NAD(P)H-dependent oxidoreductase [Methylocella sp.]